MQNKIDGRHTNRTENPFQFASFPPMVRMHYALKSYLVVSCCPEQGLCREVN